MNNQKTAVYGPGSIFNNFHEAEIHAATLTHWCDACRGFKSVRAKIGNGFICDVCGGHLLQPEIRAITEEETKRAS